MPDADKAEFRMCVYHLAHDEKLMRNDKDHDDLWKAINVMRAWVVAGSASTIFCLVGIIVQVVLIYLRGHS